MTLNAKAARFRNETSKMATRVRGIIRRFVVTLASGGLWQLAGHEDEEDSDVPVFQGVGFASLPSQSAISAGDVEVITAKVGAASNHSVVIATRDESTRVELANDETAIFTSNSIVKITSAGLIEIGSIGGTFQELATKADVDAIEEFLKDQFDETSGHKHSGYLPTAGSGSGTGFSVPSATGTTKLKAE